MSRPSEGGVACPLPSCFLAGSRTLAYGMEFTPKAIADLSPSGDGDLDDTERELASWTGYGAKVLSELKARRAPVPRAELRLRLPGTETSEGESEFIFTLWFLDTAGAIRRCNRFEEALRPNS